MSCNFTMKLQPSLCSACGAREVDPASFDWLCAPCDELQDLTTALSGDDDSTADLFDDRTPRLFA